ncbi:hypothetical protein GCM10027449_07130 [Sinomonas notoginsengisoli]|uniref:hypothetical protein n=1 Tax=Sinomonas notoginsengisoli TaxID=1457311 RepID=UPI001F410876|nr:hypothetical protein [Sinomonas notoginsengisoli]
MGFIKSALANRRDDAELGKGLWRRAHDRFRRGLDRYHQILEGIDDDVLYSELLVIGNGLAKLLPRVRAVCMEAQKRAPSEGLDIPGEFAAVHRALSRAGNALATTAEAAAMARLAVGPVPVGALSVQRRAATVSEHVQEAEELMHR